MKSGQNEKMWNLYENLNTENCLKQRLSPINLLAINLNR